MPNDFGAAMRARRQAAGLSLADLSERTGRDKGQLSRYENGHVAPSVTTAVALAAALGCRLGDLLDEQEVSTDAAHA